MEPNLSLSPESLPTAFFRTAAEHKDKAAFRCNGKTVTWQEHKDNCVATALALKSIGLQKGDRVCIQGHNSPRYASLEMGAILANGIAVGNYRTNLKELSQHVVNDSGASVVFVENEDQLKKYEGMDCSTIKAFVVWDAIHGDRLRTSHPSFGDKLHSGAEFDEVAQREMSKTSNPQETLQPAEGWNPEDTCALVYTSGTTGLPKAVMLTHDNLVWTAKSAANRLEITENDRVLSYLPISHVAAKMVDSVAQSVFGYEVDFISPEDIRAKKFKENVVRVKPTVFFGVPRIWEKMQEGIEAKVGKGSSLKQFMFHWAKNAGARVEKDRSEANKKRGFFEDLIFKISALWNRFVFQIANFFVLNPIKKAMGLDECRLFASGAGPISKKTLDFFSSLGVSITNTYGASETSGPTTAGAERSIYPNSAGRPIDGSRVKIIKDHENPERDGEVVIHGRHVFKGYWKNQKATDETLTKDGGYRTGDLGKIENEELFITGRKKELIITAGGENIPFLLLEGRLKQAAPILSEAVLVGDHRPYITCLVTLKTKENPDGSLSEELTEDVKQQLREIGSQASTIAEAKADQKVLDHLNAKREEVNKQALSQDKKIQKIRIVPRGFSIPDGTMTSTMKLKRAKIHKDHENLIEDLYSSPKAVA